METASGTTGTKGNGGESNPSPSTTTKRHARRDAAIIGTNDSSIVSKRSVERIYAASTSITNGGEYLRFVVRKPKRRSPLINRGYYVRMRAVRAVLSHHMASCMAATSGERPVIVNLGCGYDTLAFEYMDHKEKGTTLSDPTRRPYFIDVDYPELIQRKCQMIKDNPDLLNCLGNVSFDHPSSQILLKSDNYMAVGADLHDYSGLNGVLIEGFGRNAELLFISEVSIVYMEVSAANRLVEWTASFPNSSFCLLEQIVPAGLNHPFAKTMIGHFRNIGTPISLSYPTLDAQIDRFTTRGWLFVTASDLLSVWSGLRKEERMCIEMSEPFDEEEELTLFLQHYVLLHATQLPGRNYLPPQAHTITHNLGNGEVKSNWQVSFQKHSLLHRRFGAAATTPCFQSIVCHGGSDSKRLDSILVISHPNAETTSQKMTSTIMRSLVSGGAYPQHRLCHTLTELADGSLLLVGGRSSPGTVLADCWLLRGGSWTRVQDLPGGGRYRHCAASLGGAGNRALIFAGKTGHPTTTQEAWLIWSESKGWKVAGIHVTGTEIDGPCSRWSASMAHAQRGILGLDEGIVSGGISSSSGSILGDTWKWSIPEEGNELLLQRIDMEATESIFRFGAQMITIRPGTVLVVGGVCRNLKVSYEEPILEIDIDNGVVKAVDITWPDADIAPEPLLIGFHCCHAGNGRLAIFGGGALCFSFGAYWNSGIWTLSLDSLRDPSPLQWDIQKADLHSFNSVTLTGTDMTEDQEHSVVEKITVDHLKVQVPRIKLTCTLSLDEILRRGQPVVIEGLDFGNCRFSWDGAYLKAKLDPDRQIIVHEIKDDKNMNFQTKNFSYVTIPIEEFIDAVFAGSRRLYFRSLSGKGATAAPASIKDFPEICDDFRLPSELGIVQNREFSSPLRISSRNTGMWLHYDVMSNFLFHCHGEKELILFPPGDIHPKLRFAPGQSTSSIADIFENVPAGTQPQFVTMRPGDVLFIPRFWAHAASPLTPCVAVNFFYKDMPDNIYSNDGKDVYGNKDLRAYEQGKKSIRKIIDNLHANSGIPGDISALYLRRLAAELLDAAATQEKISFG